jgi:hypothetical protein
MEILFALLTGFTFLGAVVLSVILTRNAPKIRQRFFRQLIGLIAVPLFILISDLFFTTFEAPRPPKTEFSTINPSVNFERLEEDFQTYAVRMDRFLATQRFLNTLNLMAVFIFSIAPVATLAYYNMLRLEKAGADENERIF